MDSLYCVAADRETFVQWKGFLVSGMKMYLFIDDCFSEDEWVEFF